MGPALGSVDRRHEHSGIKDQGDRPTCAVFAVTAGHEWLCDDLPDLSEEFALWAAKARDGLGGEATTTAATLAGLADEGHALEVDWPYGSPRYPAQPPISAQDLLTRRRIASWRRLGNSIDDLREGILQGDDAVIIRVAFVPRAWLFSTDGWIDADSTDRSAGNHAVCAVGLAPASTARPWSVIVKNSWGSSWGDAGYGYISQTYLRSHSWQAFALKGK